MMKAQVTKILSNVTVYKKAFPTRHWSKSWKFLLVHSVGHPMDSKSLQKHPYKEKFLRYTPCHYQTFQKISLIFNQFTPKKGLINKVFIYRIGLWKVKQGYRTIFLSLGIDTLTLLDSNLFLRILTRKIISFFW